MAALGPFLEKTCMSRLALAGWSGSNLPVSWDVLPQPSSIASERADIFVQTGSVEVRKTLNVTRSGRPGSSQGEDVAQNRGRKQRARHGVFVYGTLKKGFSNHCFLRNAVFVGQGWTVNSYALYLDEYPGVYRENPVSRVRGEVYEVDTGLLARLDALEDHPVLYRREEIDVLLDDGRTVRAWIYFYHHEGGQLIAGGEFGPTVV